MQCEEWVSLDYPTYEWLKQQCTRGRAIACIQVIGNQEPCTIGSDWWS